nr:MAG TPA: hypothetical protein [Caudoviricetes sp.]
MACYLCMWRACFHCRNFDRAVEKGTQARKSGGKRRAMPPPCRDHTAI